MKKNTAQNGRCLVPLEKARKKVLLVSMLRVCSPLLDPAYSVTRDLGGVDMRPFPFSATIAYR